MTIKRSKSEEDAFRFKSEEDVFRELGRELGRAPNDTVWALLVDDRLPGDVVSPYLDDDDPGSVDDAEAAFAELVKTYRRKEGLLRDRGALNGRRRVVPLPEVAESAPSTEALAALSDIMAIEAQTHPLVVAFRERVLGGACLPPGVVAAWEQDRGQQVKWVLRPGAWPPAAARANAWEAQLDAEKYAAGELPIDGHELDFLFCVVDVLIELYGWTDSAGVAELVLSGATPSLRAAVAFMRPRERFFPKSTSLHLVVNPQMEPRKVMDLYAKMRHTYMPPNTRIRPPGEKASRLAVFVARHNDGSSWQDVWAAWNAEHDEWQSADVRSFARDARKAYRMVTGEDIEWNAGKDSGPSGQPDNPKDKG